MSSDTRTVEITLYRERTIGESFTLTKEIRLSELGLTPEEWTPEQATHYADNLVMSGDYQDGEWREDFTLDVKETSVNRVTLKGEKA